MKRWIKAHPWLGCFAALIVLVALALVVEPPIDRSRVHPPLLALKTPYRTVEASYFLHGGNVGIHIVDRNGVALDYALPLSTNRGPAYPELWYGALHLSTASANAVRLEDSAETKKYLMRVVAQNRPLTGDDIGTIVHVRGLPKDYAKALVDMAPKAPWVIRYLIREKIFGGDKQDRSPCFAIILGNAFLERRSSCYCWR